MIVDIENVCGKCLLAELPLCSEVDCTAVKEAQHKFEKSIRTKAIDEVLEALNNKSVNIIFDLPVEEVLGEDVDLDDFAMMIQDAIMAYKKMVIGEIEKLKDSIKENVQI